MRGVTIYERISIDPKVCHGQACVKGTRIPVHQIVRMLANGDTIEELLAEYPSLEREDILACLEYVVALDEKQAVQTEIREARAVYRVAVPLPSLERVEQLAEELLAECDDIEDDSRGKFDAAQDIRWMREARVSQICQSSV